jgi:hypothetical protein
MTRPMSIHDLGFRRRRAGDESSLSAVARIAFAHRPPGRRINPLRGPLSAGYNRREESS